MEFVEKLFTDLESTTSAFKEVQDKEQRLAIDLNLAQGQLFPLRKENARLTRENHQLHLENVRQHDESMAQTLEQSLSVNRIKDELDDLKTLSKMKDDQLTRKDRDNERLRQALEAATGSTKSDMITKRSIKISKPLPRATSTEEGFILPLIIILALQDIFIMKLNRIE